MSSNFVYFYANDETFFILKQGGVCILSSCYSLKVYLEAKKLFTGIFPAINESIFS